MVHAPIRPPQWDEDGPADPATMPGGPAASPAGATAPAGPAGDPPAFVFHARRQFYWKVALLAATTVALVPILLSRSEAAATVYIVALAVVHVAGIFIVAIGVKRHQIAPDKRGLAIRLVAIAILVGLLYLASKGVKTGARGVLFWGSLFAIWLLHTAGLALLHIRGRREQKVCPFV